MDNWVEAEPAPSDPFTGIFESKPEGHSRKPGVVRQRIEELTPGARRVELFSTQPGVVGWTHFGLAISPLHNFRDPAFWQGVFEAPDMAPDLPGKPLIEVFEAEEDLR